jgi:hypothetical protein
MYARNKIVFLYINDALVSVMNEQYNSIKMYELYNVKKREKECIYGGKLPFQIHTKHACSALTLNPSQVVHGSFSSLSSYFSIHSQNILHKELTIFRRKSCVYVCSYDLFHILLSL